jgi:hypothetical protein
VELGQWSLASGAWRNYAPCVRATFDRRCGLA